MPKTARSKTSTAPRPRICPICGKQITAGRLSMRQHLETHASVPVPAKTPVRSQKTTRNVTRNRQLEKGSDVIATLVINKQTKAGDILLQITLQPRALSGTRLAAQASLWARWKPIRFRTSLVSSASSLVVGSVLHAWTPDPLERLDNGISAITRISAYPVSKQAHISTPVELNVPADPSRRWYTFDSRDESDVAHGQLVVACAGSCSGFDGDFTALLHLHWEVEFDGADLTNSTASQTIHCDPGYTWYFTDSSSDWKGGRKLTLKHKQGGSIVPFPHALPGVVYALEPGATLLTYDGEHVRYAVRASDYAQYPILAVFTELQSAKTYANKPDDAQLKDYRGPGAWCDLADPAWTQMNFQTRVSKEDEISLRLARLEASSSAPPLHDVSILERLNALEEKLRDLTISIKPNEPVALD